MGNKKLREYEELSAFEIEDFLSKAASKVGSSSALTYLNARRGNPNWIATEPREAFFLLGQFALTESKRVMDLRPGLGGMPKASGISSRMSVWLGKHSEMPGSGFLAVVVPWAVQTFGFNADGFVHELVDSILGDNYPAPQRMLAHNERIVHEYLQWAMCGSPRPKGKFKLYAVDGATAALSYIFKSLKSNRLLNAGDAIALGAPIYKPYLGMPQLEGYDLKVVNIQATDENGWQFPESELDKLLDPEIKAFLLINPGNPSAVSVSGRTIARIGSIIARRPELILLTDDAYGTFVPGFRSLMGAFPHNTIGVYSYSKHFGCTGWRLGVIAVHENNVLDKLIAQHPEQVLKSIDRRYSTLSPEPRKLRFIDRIVADSRDVALSHTAGLSQPQQIMMVLFSLYELMDSKKQYQKACMGILKKRVEATVKGLGMDVTPDELGGNFYGLIDFESWVHEDLGIDVADWMKENVHPLDIVFRLAEDHGIVLLNNGSAERPDWSIRVSYANFDDHVYDDIGRAVKAVARGYRRAYEASMGSTNSKSPPRSAKAVNVIKSERIARSRVTPE